LFALFGLASAIYSALVLVLILWIWRERVSNLFVEAWTSPDVGARVGAWIICALLTLPAAMFVFGGLWSGGQWLAARTSWLSRLHALLRHHDAVAALQAVPLWHSEPRERLVETARAMRLEHVRAGAEVVRQGDVGDRFYVIDQGSFEVVVDGQTVGRLGRGDYLGERALLNNAPRAATVVATTPGRLYALDRATFQAMLAHDLATRARLEAAVDYRAEVAAMPLFRDLSPAELDLVLSRTVPATAAAGEEIVRQGEPGDRFYVIRSGSIEALVDGTPIAHLGPGEAFGEIALLLNVPRTATVRAVTATNLLTLDAQAFHDVIASYLGRGGELMRLSHLRLDAHKRFDQVAGAR
jgi:CRP-like cAMP-binding protein